MIADKDVGSGDRRNRADRSHFNSAGPPSGPNNFSNEFDNNSQPGGGVIEVRIYEFIKNFWRKKKPDCLN